MLIQADKDKVIRNHSVDKNINNIPDPLPHMTSLDWLYPQLLSIKKELIIYFTEYYLRKILINEQPLSIFNGKSNTLLSPLHYIQAISFVQVSSHNSMRDG